ncbi:ABC transporter permease [Xanthobacter dioxanivorans]|uniref:ABC transporter permease n=1 Tax=Xanthobacter dioxanivorans TaxID=2528964 RepID=A0A974PT39_9HYPH|nr:ABC transporter permease [Xanthobacter dioxanivorans]QRG09254.1 ABC transporter permease [Xanthobacter dioxanivorans]
MSLTAPSRSSVALPVPLARLAAVVADLAGAATRAPLVALCGLVVGLAVVCALLAPWISPHNPYDLVSVELSNAFLPPAWIEGGSSDFLLGTDNQGRDLLSLIIYGLRSSLGIALLATATALLVGVTVGLVSGYVGGFLDSVLMRVVDIQVAFPAILLALLIDGVALSLLGSQRHQSAAVVVLVLSIGLSHWVQFARAIRGSTLVERQKDYVSAAEVLGVGRVRILVRHILPNVAGPIVVMGTLNAALAIISEATLSFLGVGLPPTEPSLGTLVRIGNNFLFSGEWWIAVFPALVLAVLIIAVNCLGDWLRDLTNPKLA